MKKLSVYQKGNFEHLKHYNKELWECESLEDGTFTSYGRHEAHKYIDMVIDEVDTDCTEYHEEAEETRNEMHNIISNQKEGYTSFNIGDYTLYVEIEEVK